MAKGVKKGTKRGSYKKHKNHAVTCAVCGKPFMSSRSTAKYCSVTCRRLAYYAQNDMLGTITPTRIKVYDVQAEYAKLVERAAQTKPTIIPKKKVEEPVLFAPPAPVIEGGVTLCPVPTAKERKQANPNKATKEGWNYLVTVVSDNCFECDGAMYDILARLSKDFGLDVMEHLPRSGKRETKDVLIEKRVPTELEVDSYLEQSKQLYEAPKRVWDVYLKKAISKNRIPQIRIEGVYLFIGDKKYSEKY